MRAGAAGAGLALALLALAALPEVSGAQDPDTCASAPPAVPQPPEPSLQDPDRLADPDAQRVAGEAFERVREPDRGFFSSPTGVMLRSVVVPGWGQATNGEWWKAALVAGAEGVLIASWISDTNRLSELHPSDPEYARVFDRRTQRAWWLGGVVFLSMIDAFVGAHLKGIDAHLRPEPGEDGASVSLVLHFP